MDQQHEQVVYDVTMINLEANGLTVHYNYYLFIFDLNTISSILQRLLNIIIKRKSKVYILWGDNTHF